MELMAPCRSCPLSNLWKQNKDRAKEGRQDEVLANNQMLHFHERHAEGGTQNGIVHGSTEVRLARKDAANIKETTLKWGNAQRGETQEVSSRTPLPAALQCVPQQHD